MEKEINVVSQMSTQESVMNHDVDQSTGDEPSTGNSIKRVQDNFGCDPVLVDNPSEFVMNHSLSMDEDSFLSDQLYQILYLPNYLLLLGLIS